MRAPAFQTSHVSVYIGHVLDVLGEMADESVDCIVTSPPYWGLRTYGTAPQTWAGRTDCAHNWTAATIAFTAPPGSPKQATNSGANAVESTSSTCRTCGAWRGELGLEPAAALYVQHIVERSPSRVTSAGGLWASNSTTSTCLSS